MKAPPLALAMIVWTLVAAPPAQTEEPAPPKEAEEGDLVVTQYGGMRMLSLKDWPTKRQGGVVTAVPLEEYLSMKFGKVQERLKALEPLDARMIDLDRRLGAIETHQRAMLTRIEVLEAGASNEEGRDGDTTQEPQATEGAPEPAP